MRAVVAVACLLQGAKSLLHRAQTKDVDVPHPPLPYPALDDRSLWALRQERANTGVSEKITDIEKEQAIEDVQKFIKDAPEGFATLVLMGDSTVAGLTSELLAITQEVEWDEELVYVSNDRARAVHYAGFVKPGGEWVNESSMTDQMATLTVQRAQASTKALHALGCKSGGGLETYVMRAGPFKGLVVHHWGFLPEYTDFCWDHCMTQAMAALKPTAVMWNIGFHLLNHDYNPAICAIRHNPTKTNCGDHKQMVKLATRSMIDSGIQTVVWKHTNFLCEARQNIGFPATAEALVNWHDESRRSAMEATCHTECPDYMQLPGATPCYDWFFDAHTSERLHEESTAALTELQAEKPGAGIHVLDAFATTKSCCDQGCEKATEDGEHYTGLDATLMANLASILSKRVSHA